MTNYYWEAIVNYMDDDIREQVHAELAPCTKAEFMARYCELDHSFKELITGEFSEGYIRAAMVEGTYYFPIDWGTFDIFGMEMPVCIDKAECKRLAREYNMNIDDFMSEMREATMQEIQECGIYNGKEC